MKIASAAAVLRAASLGPRNLLAAVLCALLVVAVERMPASAEAVIEDAFEWGTNYDPSPRASEVLFGQHVRPMLGPASVDTMLQAIAHYQIIVRRGGWPAVGEGQTLVVGSRGERVSQLVERLMISGDFTPPDGFDRTRYDKTLAAAVTDFQIRHGILATGSVDERTRLAMNVPAEHRLRMLELNLTRMRTYVENLGSRYVVVNIPATELETVQDGFVYSRHVTIVGKVDRPSPEVVSRIVQVNFNPYWHAPPSIVEKDILPQLRQSTAYIKQLNIRVFEGSYYGNEVDPDTIDWTKVTDPNRYYFRQEPGGDNAMATMRINFPNDHQVYLHDTPTKSLFLNATRYDSSGCVRVDEVHTFAEWLLRGQGEWNMGNIERVADSRERLDLDIARPVPLRIVYLTAWATDSDDVHFRPDIYSLDRMGGVNASSERSEGAVTVTEQSSSNAATGAVSADGIGNLIEEDLLTGTIGRGRFDDGPAN
jgi:murein L,D-transpeptidase YcbB/YkuD